MSFESAESLRQKLSETARAGHEAQVVRGYIGRLLDREEQATITAQRRLVRASPLDQASICALAVRLDVLGTLRSMLDTQISAGKEAGRQIARADQFAESFEVEY